MQTEPGEFLYVCGAGTDHTVGPAPVKFEGAIIFRYGPAGENNVMHITGNFPRVLRLKDPVIGHPQNSGRILQIVKGKALPVDCTVHSGKNPVVDVQPAPAGFYRGGSGTYFHLIPMIREWLH